MQIRGESALVQEVQDRGLCVECGGCVGLCPYFRSHRGRVAKLFDCGVDQGRCHAQCPKTEVDLDAVSQKVVGQPYDASPAGHLLSIWKARAGSRMQGRASYQNGGAVSSLLALAFDSHLVDAAALTDRKGLIPAPKVVTDVDGVLACASSKYMASPTVSAFHGAMDEGYSSIAMVGTPCQLTAVGQLRMDGLGRLDKDPVALTLGLFCTWSIDTRALLSLAEAKVGGLAITGMEVTPPPDAAFCVDTEKGRVSIPLDEVRGAIPEGCAICPDMTAEFCDISVGANEADTSWNTLIVRTEKGRDLIDEAVALDYLEAMPLAEAEADALFSASLGKKRRTLAKAQELGLLNSEEGPSALRMPHKVFESIMASNRLQEGV